jgi:hypothetical protein
MIYCVNFGFLKKLQLCWAEVMQMLQMLLNEKKKHVGNKNKYLGNYNKLLKCIKVID